MIFRMANKHAFTDLMRRSWNESGFRVWQTNALRHTFGVKHHIYVQQTNVTRCHYGRIDRFLYGKQTAIDAALRLSRCLGLFGFQ